MTDRDERLDVRDATDVEEAMARADNPSGMKCDACRSVGFWHCSDPANCGGMEPMDEARRPAKTAGEGE